MASKIREDQRPSYAYGAVAAGLSPDAGQRQYNSLFTSAQTHRVDVTVSGNLIVTGAGTKVRGRGSILQAFVGMGLDENGVDQINVDPRMLRQLAEYGVESSLSNTRLGAVAVATYPLKETFPIYFAHPRSLSPRETSFMVHDPKQSLRLWHILNGTANGVANIMKGGAATLENVKVSVTQVMDEFEVARPLFIPRYRMIQVQVPAANSALEVNVVVSQFLRSIMIMGDSSVGEQSDVINSVALLGDKRHLLGPTNHDWDILTRRAEIDNGGAVYTPKAFYRKNFQLNGRLSEIWNPGQDNNLRFRFDCQPTSDADATSTTIKILLEELVRDSSTTPDGVLLTAPLEIAV